MADDPRIDQLVDDVAALKVAVRANTEITAQVRDTLSSFKMVAIIAKWIAAVGGAVVVLWGGFDFIKKL